jgi:hypothetical protein
VWFGSWVLNVSWEVAASVFRAEDWGRQFLRYPLTKLHGVTTQKIIIIIIFTFMRDSDLPQNCHTMGRGCRERQCSWLRWGQLEWRQKQRLRNQGYFVAWWPALSLLSAECIISSIWQTEFFMSATYLSCYDFIYLLQFDVLPASCIFNNCDH